MSFLSSFLIARRAAPGTGASFRRGTDTICGFFSFGHQGKPIWALARQIAFLSLSCTLLSHICLTVLVFLLVPAPQARSQQHN